MEKRKSTMSPLSGIIAEVLKNLGIEKKLLEARVVREWPDIVGYNLARYTQNIYVKEGILFVWLSSSVVKNELLMIRTALLHSINERMGQSVITDIIIK